MEFFTWLDSSGFAIWIREWQAGWAYDVFLAAHSVGMAVLVGLSAAIYLRVLGFAPSLPLAPMERFFPLMYAGFWVNAISGVFLFVCYPVKAVTYLGFYLKMGGVVLAVMCLRRLKSQVFGNPACLGTEPVPTNGKILAGTALLIWAVTITVGRLMAYYDDVGVVWQTSLAVLIASVVLLLAGFIASRLWGWSKQLRQGV